MTVSNFVKIGSSVQRYCNFQNFQDGGWPPPPCRVFEIAKFYLLTGSRGRDISSLSACKISSIYLYIGQLVTKILFFYFSRWPPYAILDLFGAYLDHPHLGVSITLKFGYDSMTD